MVNSQDKGKRFERKIAKKISKVFDFECRRTPNSGGLSIKGDIMSLRGISADFHWELKNQEKLNIWKALRQAENDCKYKIPTVVFTKNHEDDYVALRFDDFLNLLLEIKQLREEKENNRKEV